MTAWDFLNNNLGSVIIITIAIILFLFVVLILILKRFNVKKIGPVEFSVRKASFYADRFMRVIERIRECEREITRMLEGDILREQMRVAELAIADLVRESKKIHLDVINQRTTDENHKRTVEEINTYHLRIEIAADDLKYEFRRSFRQNHFVEKTPKEFSDFIEREMQIMLSIVEDSIDHRYSSVLIDLPELRKMNRAKMGEFKRLLEKVYLEALEIVKMYNGRVQSKRDEIRSLTVSYLSGSPIDGCLDTEENNG